MLSVAYYSLFLVMGVVYADKLFKDKSTYFKLWSGGIIGNIILMFGIIPLAFLLGFTKFAHILLAIFSVVPYLFMKKDLHISLKKPDMWAFLCGGIILGIIFVILENHVLVPTLDGLATGQSTYGDTAMHLGFISSIAESGKFPPDFNLLWGHKLCYPFLVDSLSSSLYLFGADLRSSLMVPSFVLLLLTVMGFYYFAESLTNRKTAILAMVLFFLGGGFGFIYFLDGGLENFTRIFTEYYQTPTNLVEKNIRWVNPICDMLIPQRTTMAGWCVLLFALWLLCDALKNPKRQKFLVLGIVAGSMPMIHTHSFLALALISAGCAVAFYGESSNKKEYIVNMCIYAGVAFLLSIGQLWEWTFSQSIGNSQFLRFGFNWVNHSDNYLWFWLKNWGITALFLIPALLCQNSFNKKFSLGFLFVFVLAELVIFQPNEYDNNKLFFPVYMLAVVFVSEWILQAKNRIKFGGAFCAVAIFLGTFSGVLSIIREIKSGGDYLFFTHSDVEFAEFVKENTQPDALFITGIDHINPVAVLSGRTIYAGSELYVYFHGYGDEMYKRYDVLEKIYQSHEKAEILQSLPKTDAPIYLVLSDRERREYEIDQGAFSEFEAIYNKDGIRLYKIDKIISKIN